MGAFMPLMENGGNDAHTPWDYESPNSTLVVDTYRKFVVQHYEMVPYLTTCGTQAYEGGYSVIIPITPAPTDFSSL